MKEMTGHTVTFRKLFDAKSYPFYSKEAGYTHWNLCCQGKQVASVNLAGEPSEQNEKREVVGLIVKDKQLAKLYADGESCYGCQAALITVFGKPDKVIPPDEIDISGLSYLTDTADIAILFDDDLSTNIIIAKKNPAESSETGVTGKEQK